jgi:hypothetical protein
MPKLSSEESKFWQPVIRELIKQENDLVNQRMTWLIQSQGLLFTAVAFAWEKAPKALTLLISILGVATALSLWSAIGLYSPAVRELRTWWDEHRSDDSVVAPGGDGVMGRWSPSSGIGRYFRPWRALPLIFIVAWMGILILALFMKPTR